MKGTERGPKGETLYFYQYKPGGAKHYYTPKKKAEPPIWEREWYPRRPTYRPEPELDFFIPPRSQLSKFEMALRQMDSPVQKLISTWLLAMDFQSVNDLTPDEINKSFRKLSLKHHPDRGGREENYKQLTAVRDHLLTLCAMAEARG